MNEITSRNGRWAVAAMFLANGFITGSWAPQIPVLLSRLQITEFTLGLLILGFGLGALSAMPVTGYLISHHGARRMLSILAVATSFGLLFVAVTPNLWTAAAAMYFFGATIGSMDVSMNANAVTVERRLRRAIMSSSHGFWSLGGFIGGGLGGLAIERFGSVQHAIGVTVVSLAVVIVALPWLVADETPEHHAHARRRLPRSPVIYLIGIVALFCMIPEGAVLDWAAIYLQQEMGASLAVAGFAFAGFSAAMALMRFLGDAVRNRFGAVRTLRACALIAASGMAVAGLSTSPWLAIAAFTFCGFGIANMVPIAFSAAGNQPGMAPGTGMAVATTIGYSGILVAPSLVGFVAEHTGLAPVYLALAGILVVVSLMAPLTRTADFAHATATHVP